MRAHERVAAWFLVCATVLSAGCTGPDGDDGQDGAASESMESPGRFPPGIYHLVPATRGPPAAALAHLPDGLHRTFDVLPVGYDLQPSQLVYGDSDTHLFVVDADGERRTASLRGIHTIGRPSFSPDGTRAAVQALEGDAVIGTASEDLNIYVVDLATGESTRMSHLDVNEESPAWVSDELLAYSSFDPETGIDLHIVDARTGAEVRTIDEAGELHVAASQDGRFVVQGPNLRIYSVEDGALVADLGDAARDAVEAAGYDIARGRGGMPDAPMFPLAAAFSPDGRQLVFDGVVRHGARQGALVATMGTDGSGFALVSDLIEVDPDRANGNNFSQVDPRWL